MTCTVLDCRLSSMQGSEALVKHGGRVGNCHMVDEKGYIAEPLLKTIEVGK